jgi:hypothetical protein
MYIPGACSSSPATPGCLVRQKPPLSVSQSPFVEQVSNREVVHTFPR